jgi:hypothetical protein
MTDFWNSPLGIALGFAAGLLGVYVVALPLWWWWDRRHWQRFQQRHAARQRQWDLAQQLREVEAQIREEQLSDEERAWRRAYQARQAEIRQEARRRLGLPEEDT